MPSYLIIESPTYTLAFGPAIPNNLQKNPLVLFEVFGSELVASIAT